MTGRTLAAAGVLALFLGLVPSARADDFPWLTRLWPAMRAEALHERFAPPAGFERAAAGRGTFADWLRSLPLKPTGAPVLLHNGQPKARQDVHAAVIDIDVGMRDLQQCADAVMRLRAEWLFASGQAERIAFNDTGGGNPMSYARWAAGERPRASGNRLVWASAAAADRSYSGFRRYMDTVFVWAGTASLERELRAVPVADVAAGDVFIKGGFPGHAVLVVDVATRDDGGKRILLAQSYMPAQNIHILKNPQASDGSPWYDVADARQALVTPEWTFPPGSLKRWR